MQATITITETTTNQICNCGETAKVLITRTTEDREASWPTCNACLKTDARDFHAIGHSIIDRRGCRA